jgi:hypothetical protein
MDEPWQHPRREASFKRDPDTNRRTLNRRTLNLKRIQIEEEEDEEEEKDEAIKLLQKGSSFPIAGTAGLSQTHGDGRTGT